MSLELTVNAPENGLFWPTRKRDHLPSIRFQVAKNVEFQGGSTVIPSIQTATIRWCFFCSASHLADVCPLRVFRYCGHFEAGGLPLPRLEKKWYETVVGKRSGEKTSWYGKYPIIYRVSYMSGGAGFLPSTYLSMLFCNPSTSLPNTWGSVLGPPNTSWEG